MISNKSRKETFDLEALRSKDRLEFARLVDSYSASIYRLANKILDNPQDAEDVLQETFIKAYQNLAGFDGRSSILTWLYRIATNESLMALRRKKRATVSIDAPDNDDGEQEPLEIVDWCCMPEEELMSSETKAYLKQAIDSLSPNLRVVFLLRDIEGLSTEEVSDVLGLSEMAVKTRLSRARFKLRELLSEYFGERMGRYRMAEGE